MVGVENENLAVHSLGVAEAAGAMKFDSSRKVNLVITHRHKKSRAVNLPPRGFKLRWIGLIY